MPKSESRHPELDIAWDDVRLFLAIAESGSLSEAARRLRLGQPTVSRRLAELEEELGHPLFRRHVGGAALTPEAERLLEPARRMAEWAGEIARTAARADGTPQGLVRVATFPGLAFDFLAPFAGWLRTRHPKIQLEVLTSVYQVDLARREADLALRFRAPTSADLQVVETLPLRNAVFVSRSYAKRLPKRVTLQELDWICWSPPFEDVAPNPQLAELIPGFRPAFTSDNYLVQFQAAASGLGAILLGDLQHRFTQKSGLVPLDLDLGPFSRSDLHLVCAKSALEISRVRVVAELIAEEMRAIGTGARSGGSGDR